jgi:hypothetical protein
MYCCNIDSEYGKGDYTMKWQAINKKNYESFLLKDKMGGTCRVYGVTENP